MAASPGGGLVRRAACAFMLVATGACATSTGAPSGAAPYGGGQPSGTQPPVAATAAAATVPPSTPTPVPYRPQVVTTFNMTEAPNMSEAPFGAMTLNETTHRLYLAVLSGLQVIDTVTGNVVAINFPATYFGTMRINPTTSLAVNTKTNRLYVLDSFAGVLSIVDGASNSVLESVTVGDLPSGVAVNSATGRVYVINATSNTLSVLDSSNRIVATVALKNPIAVVASEAANRVYVSVSDPLGLGLDGATNGLVVLDGATNTILQTLPYSLAPSALSDAPARIYGRDGDVVRIYDVAAGTWTTAATIRHLSGLSVDARGDRLYVGEDLTKGGLLHVFSGDGTSEFGSVPIDGVPRGISADSSSGRVYVSWSTNGCSLLTPGVCQGGVLVVQGAGPP